MNYAYSNELRTDTAVLLIPLIGGTMALGLLLFAVTVKTFALSWHLWFSIGLTTISSLAGWHYLKRDRTGTGTIIFTASHLLILFLLIFKNWTPNSVIPYLFAILILASSIFTQPDHGFITWGTATVLTALGISAHTSETWDLLAAACWPYCC